MPGFEPLPLQTKKKEKKKLNFTGIEPGTLGFESQNGTKELPRIIDIGGQK